jgi:LacI family transcriptional regulator
VLDTGNPFFTDVARGVEEAARAAGRAMFLCNSASDPGRQKAYLDLLEQHRVEGILIISVDGPSRQLEQPSHRPSMPPSSWSGT